MVTVMIGVMVPSVFAPDPPAFSLDPNGETFTVVVEIAKESYYPADITIRIGDTVRWINIYENHTVTSGSPADGPSGVFDRDIRAGGYYSFTFEDAGNYDYFCMVHPWMIGTILVLEDGQVECLNCDQYKKELIGIDDVEIMGGTQIKLEFSEYHVNYDMTATQNGEVVFEETGLHSMKLIATHQIDAVGSDDNPINVKVEFLGIGPPGDSDNWTGPVGQVTTKEVGKEFRDGVITYPPAVVEKETPSEVIEKSKFKKYSDNKYNFSLEYPAEFDSHFKGVDSTPMIWKNSPHPELPWFKVWKTVKTIPEGLFATTYEFKVYSDNEMSEYSQSELLDLLENSSINLFTDMCSPENCTVTKTDSNISTNGNGAKILDIIVQSVTNYEKGVTQYITNSMRITMLNANNDILMIQHTTSSSDNFTHLFYESHFTHMIKSLETQYIPKDSLKNTSTIFTAYGETVVTPENGVEEYNQNHIFIVIALIVGTSVITILFVIKNKGSKKSSVLLSTTPVSSAPASSSTVEYTKGSQGNIPIDIDKQIALNEEKIRKIEKESKKLDKKD